MGDNKEKWSSCRTETWLGLKPELLVPDRVLIQHSQRWAPGSTGAQVGGITQRLLLVQEGLSPLPRKETGTAAVLHLYHVYKSTITPV